MIFQLSTTREVLFKIHHVANEVEQPYGFVCSLKSYWSAEVGNEFIQGSNHWETLFGKFLPSDRYCLIVSIINL